MFDTEKLIVEVEQRPYLWNLSEKSYSDKFLKQKAWQEVAENCFEEWNNLRNEDKEKNIFKSYQTVKELIFKCNSPENTDNDDSNITGNNDDEDLDEQFRSTEADSPLYQPSTSQPASMKTPVYQNQPSTSKQTAHTIKLASFSSPFSDSHSNSSNQYYPTPVNRGYTTQANEYHSNETNEYDET
ncbi:hypothetical protein ACJJTC_009708 [Scirpophaga incertulas]